jgi:hypothetical protein
MRIRQVRFITVRMRGVSAAFATVEDGQLLMKRDL